MNCKLAAHVGMAIVCAWICAGCWESTDSSQDEQQDLYYRKGLKLKTSLDYTGAAEAFEKALEVNPRNGSAHFELFILNEQHFKDYAAAIYYGQKFNRLRTNSPNAELVRLRIPGCIQDLAKSQQLGPVTPALVRDLEKVKEENKKLRLNIDELNQRLLWATSRPPPVLSQPSNTVAIPSAAGLDSARGRSGSATGLSATKPAAPIAIPATIGAQPKTHVVKSGETIATIARRYRVSQNALLTANPTVNSRRLKVGQLLRIPAT